VVIGNYTWTHSALHVGANDTTEYYTPAKQTWDANQFFRDGSRLTGQSDHLVNLQLGFERPSRLSQQTLLLSWASDRVTSRGPVGSGFPDIRESPGLRVDFVARQGFNVMGQDMDLKLEVRNLLGRGYKEFQRRGDNVVYFNKYDIGTAYSLSVSMEF
jgi:hypothetical protein